MSSNIANVQILRSYANSTPLNLLDGQLAFSFKSNTLFIGSNTGGVIAISDQATANLARQLSNTKVSKTGDTMTGVLYFQGATANTAVGGVEQANGIDLFANTGALWAQLNYANTNYVWVDSQVAAMSTDGVSFTLQQQTLDAVLSAGGQIYTFHNDGNLQVPAKITVPTAIINGYDIFDYSNASFTKANSSANLTQAAYNQANLASGGLSTANANTIYLQGGLNSANVNISLLFSTNVNQNANITLLQTGLNTANANTVFLQGGLNTANANTVFLTGALATANANTIFLTGVNTTQNTWISSNSLYSQAAFAQANLASGGLATANANTVFLQGALNTANANTVFLSGVNTTQNTWISSNSLYSQAAYAQANLVSGGLVTANANTVFLSGVNTTQNTWISSNSLYSQAAYAQANLVSGGLVTANANTIFLTGVNTTQNANISLLFTNTSPNLYLTTVGSSVNSIALGGAPVQNAQVWGTYTIVQVLDTLLFPTTGPTYTIPTITLSANNSGTFEIGQPINQSLTVTGTKNDAGAFTQLRINRNTINLTTNTSPTTTTTTNIASQFGFSDPNNQNYTYANTYVDANTIVSGATTWTGYGNYSAGLAKLNNKGATDSNAFTVLTTTAPQAANATTFATSSTTITGIYPYFWGVSSTQPTAASIATAIAAGTQNKVLAVGSGTLTITYNASSQYIWIAVQTGYAAKTTWYNTALNNGSVGAGQFILSPVSQAVNSPSSYWSGVTYNVYISGYATTTSGTIAFS